MEKAKRIIFSTECPNDQGGIIPNNVLDFSRFLANPVILPEHDWTALPIGLMQDIRFEGDKWTGLPVFHGLTEESKTYKKLWEANVLKACSIGGDCQFKTTGQTTTDQNGNRVPVYFKNEDGFRIAEKFTMYEISMVTLPSNSEALGLHAAKFYEQEAITENITKLSTNLLTLKSKTMAKEIIEPIVEETKEVATTEQVVEVEKTEVTPEVVATVEPDKSAHVVLKAGIDNESPEFIDKIINSIETGFNKVVNAFKPSEKVTEEALPIHTNEEGGSDQIVSKPATVVTEEAVPIHTNEEGGNDPAKEEMKPVVIADQPEPTGLECEKAKKDKEEAEEKADIEAKEKEKTTMSAKTPDQLKAEGTKLAPTPKITLQMTQFGNNTFTKLRAELNSGKVETNEGRAFNRILNKETHTAEAGDYAMLATAIMNDPKMKPIVEKVRFISNMNRAQYDQRDVNGNPSNRQGSTLQSILSNVTTLGTSADALANPEIYALEWLTLAIFKLFPDNSWKTEIPVFGVSETSKNKGVIWTNIEANPTIHIGAKPTITNAYAAADVAVGLSLTPYWLEPMAFEPLSMHQLRYDQMGTNWNQAFAKMESVIDDMLLYTLASTVPVASRVKTSGASFNIAAITDPNAFYWGTFTGDLASMTLNDILRLEQLYKKQNFDLKSNKPVIVMDTTMDLQLSSDSEVKNKLTEWKNFSGAEFLEFRHTILHNRSRVAMYDPSAAVVKDPFGVIPSTATSAAVSFIPSQVGIGLGMLDVFMLQSPRTYGYEMSADIRKGIAPLRKNYNGTALLNYGTPTGM